MDLALAIDALVPSAAYGGSTTANNQAAYDALRWEDARAKPTWDAIVAAWTPLATKASAKAAARAQLEAGFLVEEGFRLRGGETAQNALTRLQAHIGRKNPQGNKTITLVDSTGTPRQVTWTRFQQILDAYGDWALAQEIVLRS